MEKIKGETERLIFGIINIPDFDNNILMEMFTNPEEHKLIPFDNCPQDGKGKGFFIPDRYIKKEEI